MRHFNGYPARKTCPLCHRAVEFIPTGDGGFALNQHYDQRTGKICHAGGHSLADATKLASEKTAEATR